MKTKEIIKKSPKNRPTVLRQQRQGLPAGRGRSKKGTEAAVLERIDDGQKNWKFSSNDAAERDFWNDYMKAYEEMIQQTATKKAPWYVVPADNKWFTRVVVAGTVIETLADLDLAYPKVGEGKLKELVTAKNKLLKK